MDRRFYFFAIFFTVLNLITGLLTDLANLMLQGHIVALEYFVGWFVFVSGITFIASGLLLRYYYYKKYWVTFSVSVVFLVVILCHFGVLTFMLINQEQEGIFKATRLVVLGMMLLYALTLIFSNARKRPLLRAVGVVSLVVGLAMLLTPVWLNRWATIIMDLVLVLIIINYVRESRLAKREENPAAGQVLLYSLMAILAVGGASATLVFGGQVAIETLHKSGYFKVTEAAKRLAEAFEARAYVTRSGETFRYRLMKPLDYDPKKKYPLVVCLHHGGSHGTDNIIQIDGSGAAQLLSAPANRQKYPAFIFVPQCPNMSEWRVIQDPVFEMIHSLEADFAIDSNKLYVTGVSGGGYGSWAFITARPKMFAAAIPVCGGGDLSHAQDIIDVPVWAFQGELDKFVPARLQRAMIAAIRKAGGHPRYTEFPGEGHNIWDKVSQTPGLLDWLFAQERK